MSRRPYSWAALGYLKWHAYMICNSKGGSKSCRYYADLAGEENAKAYKTIIFLAGSASAEFFADIGLCPFEAVKVTPPPPLSYTWEVTQMELDWEHPGGGHDL